MSGVTLLNQGGERGGSTGNMGVPASPIQISQRLQKAMLRMTGKFLTEKGLVDYKGLKESDEFREYRALASQLKNIDLGGLVDKEKTAFFINLYNALTMDSIIQQKTTPASTLEVPEFWTSYGYLVASFTLNLDHIEHGVLRGNRPHPSSESPLFPPGDPRLALVCPHPDPRVHFALNCGAKTCPMVRVYNADRLEEGLESATTSYLRQEVSVLEGRLRLPQILEWYMTDFAPSRAGMIRWVQKYLDKEVQDIIDTILVSGGDGDGGDGSSGGEDKTKTSTDLPVEFFYDWSLNNVV